MLKIIEAHWSTHKEDSHSENDADGTYAVVNENEKIVEIFTKKQEAEDFINKNQNI